MPTGVGELDRVLGRRARAGLGHAARGRARHGQEHAAAPGARAHGRRGARAACWSPPRSRARRCGCGPSGSARSQPDLLVVAETSLAARPRPRRRRTGPQVLALDSIQTVLDPDLPGAPGSVTQVRDCAYRLVQHAKEHELRHGARRPRHQGGHARRARACSSTSSTPCSRSTATAATRCALLHALKHRFGGTDELGLFEMTEHGLVDVPDASARFLVDRRPGVPGSAVAAVLEGARPLLVEVQALVMRTAAPMPRRSAAGIESGRLAMLLAVLERHAAVQLADRCRRLRERRGRSPRHRARPRPRARARGRRRAALARHRSCGHGGGRRARARRRGAQRCRSSNAGSPRRRASGSGARSCPRARDRRAGIDGLELVRGEQPA